MSKVIVIDKMLIIALKIADVETDIETLKRYSENTKFYPEVCPLAIPDDGEKDYHYFNSLLLSGQGQQSWECPFCGMEFVAKLCACKNPGGM